MGEGNRFDFLGPVGQEGSPGGSVIKNLPANAGDAGGGGFPSLSGEDLLEKEMATHSSILAWENPMDR